jgi:hypothetical protein
MSQRPSGRAAGSMGLSECSHNMSDETPPNLHTPMSHYSSSVREGEIDTDFRCPAWVGRPAGDAADESSSGSLSACTPSTALF